MRVLALAGVVVALAACTASVDNGNVDVDPMTDRIGDWSGDLEPQAGTQVLGRVAAQSAVASTGVSVTISGASAGARHPWHIYRGTCGSNGPIVGDASVYPVLSAGSDGIASASANLNVGLSEDASYYVNIHRSPNDLGTIVACGQLRH